MSFTGFKDFIEEGDLVIAFANLEVMSAVRVKRGDAFNNKFGCFKHADMIGRRFGSKMTALKGGGWILLLHPTPELWTLVLPHRTQILYAADIAMITLGLDLQPGSVVCESGTGSGSLSHAIARTIAPSGHLHTFEFHQQRADMARSEFEQHGLAPLITVRCVDVCDTQGPGFGLHKVADAVFLDLPQPWLALPTALKALKAGGRLCSFSPCIEQVQRMCDAMRASHFADVRTVECLERPFDFTTPLPQPRLKQDTDRGRKRKAEGGEDGEEEPEERKGRRAGGGWETAARQQIEARGHTGFLTFGTYTPPPSADQPAAAAAAAAAAATNQEGQSRQKDTNAGAAAAATAGAGDASGAASASAATLSKYSSASAAP